MQSYVFKIEGVFERTSYESDILSGSTNIKYISPNSFLSSNTINSKTLIIIFF